MSLSCHKAVSRTRFHAQSSSFSKFIFYISQTYERFVWEGWTLGQWWKYFLQSWIGCQIYNKVKRKFWKQETTLACFINNSHQIKIKWKIGFYIFPFPFSTYFSWFCFLLLDQTQILVDSAESISVTGAIKAFDEEFKLMQNNIDEIQRILSSVNFTQVDVHDIKTMLEYIK